MHQPMPVPASQDDRLRVQHTRLRRRMLLGMHRDDVIKWIRSSVGNVRADAWGEPDLSCDVLPATASALATLYDPAEDSDEGSGAAHVLHADEGAAGLMSAVLDDAGIWPMMQRVQRDTLGLREMLLKVDTDLEGDAVRMLYRPVPPDMVEVDPDPRAPHRAIEIREWVQHGETWVQDVWSLRNGGVRRFLAADGRDVSRDFGLPEGGQTGDAYPARRADGRALLPYVIHHAALTGMVFDPFTGYGLVDGQLQCSLGYTFYWHVVRSCAWGQRWTIGAEIDGTTPNGDGTRSAVADPSGVVSLRAQEGFDGQPSAGMWSSPTNPEDMFLSIQGYERRLQASGGVAEPDVERTADPRSGVALVVNARAREKYALRYSPAFRRSDVEMVTVTAVLYNRALGEQLFPEDGWGIEHAPIRAIRLRQERALGGHGSPVDGEAAAAPVEKVADTALNGAQVVAAQGIVSGVARGELPRDAAVAMLIEFFQLDPKAADRVLGTVGRGFRPVDPE